MKDIKLRFNKFKAAVIKSFECLFDKKVKIICIKGDKLKWKLMKLRNI